MEPAVPDLSISINSHEVVFDFLSTHKGKMSSNLLDIRLHTKNIVIRKQYHKCRMWCTCTSKTLWLQISSLSF